MKFWTKILEVSLTAMAFCLVWGNSVEASEDSSADFYRLGADRSSSPLNMHFQANAALPGLKQELQASLKNNQRLTYSVSVNAQGAVSNINKVEGAVTPALDKQIRQFIKTSSPWPPPKSADVVARGLKLIFTKSGSVALSTALGEKPSQAAERKSSDPFENMHRSRSYTPR